MLSRFSRKEILWMGLLIILALLTHSKVSASSVKQVSGDADNGKFEFVTNEFPTFEAAKSFFDGPMEEMLSQQEYQGDLLAVDPSTSDTTYIIKMRVNFSKYHAGSSRFEVEKLSWEIIAAADQAIAKIKPIPGQNSQTLINVYRLYHPNIKTISIRQILMKPRFSKGEGGTMKAYLGSQKISRERKSIVSTIQVSRSISTPRTAMNIRF